MVEILCTAFSYKELYKNYQKVVDKTGQTLGKPRLLVPQMFGIWLDFSFLMCYTFRRKQKRATVARPSPFVRSVDLFDAYL